MGLKYYTICIATFWLFIPKSLREGRKEEEMERKKAMKLVTIFDAVHGQDCMQQKTASSDEAVGI